METRAKKLNCLSSYSGLNRFSLGQISHLLRLTKESYCNLKLKYPDTEKHTDENCNIWWLVFAVRTIYSNYNPEYMTKALVHARALLSIKKINNNNNNKFWWKLDNYITNYITSPPANSLWTNRGGGSWRHITSTRFTIQLVQLELT